MHDSFCAVFLDAEHLCFLPGAGFCGGGVGFLSSVKEKRHFSQEIWWLGNTVNPPHSPVFLQKSQRGGRPWVGPGVKDPPANAGVRDSSPDLGRSHKASKPTLPQLLNHFKIKLLNPAWPRTPALQQAEPPK